jgi:prepilin-type processing-associated H-X9-DG protein
MRRTFRNRCQALTLVEVVVVIIAIGLLSVLLTSAVSRARESARRSSCMSSTRCIGLAIKQYAVDNSDVFPPASNGTAVSGFCILTGAYLAAGRAYNCASDRAARPGSTFATCTNSYCYVTESADGKIPMSESNSSFQVLMLDKGLEGSPNASVLSRTNSSFSVSGSNPHQGEGGNAYFVGGHVKWIRKVGQEICGPPVIEGTNGFILRAQ